MTTGFITEAEIDSWFSILQAGVRRILTEEENLLGVLEFTGGNGNGNVIKTIPAIYRKKKELSLNKWRMQPGSGILCIIHESIDINFEPLIGGSAAKMFFPIELVQYNPDKTNTAAILRLKKDSFLEIFEDPVTTPFTELENGVTYERTMLKAEVFRRL